ncbi:MAG: hypothetical protein SVV80_05500 [Planctomycetota bacterium]|nr:hypothetical protein [Planctomycetota bacterium]
MILSKREKIIITATLVAISVLVLDRYALTPLLDRYSAVRTRKEMLLAETRHAENLLALHRKVAPRWRILTGSLKSDPAEAESQMLHALRDWSEQAGLNLSLLRPERSTEKTDLREITFHVAGDGTMRSVSRFLWSLETADIPTRLKTMQLRSRKEGIDDLSVQLRISTLYLSDESPLPPGRGNEIASEGGIQ